MAKDYVYKSAAQQSTNFYYIQSSKARYQGFAVTSTIKTLVEYDQERPSLLSLDLSIQSTLRPPTLPSANIFSTRHHKRHYGRRRQSNEHLQAQQGR